MSTILFNPKTTRRFLSRFTFGNKDQCWEWFARKTYEGYGLFDYAGAAENAHRVSWRMFRGDIPDGLCVLHVCDNPSCVNPSHLFLGTRGDNNKDRARKGRTVVPCGAANPRAKLTQEQVDEIRRLHSTGACSYSQLIAIYPVCMTTISKVINRQAYK